MKGIVALLSVAVVIAVAASSVVVVDETEHAVITAFGRPVRVLSTAGPYLKLPAPLQRVTRLDRRTLFTATRETELLTADKKNIVVSAYVSWHIADPVRYLVALGSRPFAETRLTALIQSELGSALGDLPFTRLVPAESASGGLSEIETKVRTACQEVARKDFGIEVSGFGVTRLNFPFQNQQSVFARMRAERERIARGVRSEGEAEAQKMRAEADRERSDLLADAESEASRLRGEGEAEAARIYGDAYRGHEDFYHFLRTLESYEKTLGSNTTLVLPADAPFLELLTARVPSNARPGQRAPEGDR